MKPFYWNTANFGDHINSWLWRELFPELITNDSIRLVGVGSLIQDNLELVPGKKVIVGSGAGYGAAPSADAVARWDVWFVRGPLTSQAMGLPDAKAVVDGSWLVHSLPGFFVPQEKRGVVFVPHWTSARSGHWQRICDLAGVTYIDPCADSKQVIAAIASSRLAIVEALHGAILADLYRTPWVPVSTERRILAFKWIDWCTSVGLEYRPYALPPSDYFDFAYRRQRPRQAEAPLPQLSPTAEPLPEAANSPRTVTTSYRLLQKAKPVVRTMISDSIGMMSPVRNAWPLSSWNARHVEVLSKEFARLAALGGVLSSDMVRAQKLDILNDIVVQFRRQWT